MDHNKWINWDWFPESDEDEDYWTTLAKGYDCNGNMGEDLYCYCPSQGYNCGCQPIYWPYDVPRLECADHQGFNCDGEIIDGEEDWCNDKDS